MRVGAQIKFTRGREVLTASVCWVGQKPLGSNNFLIGAETDDDLPDPGNSYIKMTPFKFIFRLLQGLVGMQ